jgi:hypothetical protein
MPEDRASKPRLEEEAVKATEEKKSAKLAHDYVHWLNGFRIGGGACRVRIYRGEGPKDAPVVICSELPAGEQQGREAANVMLLAEYLAGEVVRDRFPAGLPDLPRPLLWIEQRFTFEDDPQEYLLLTFPFYHPRPAGLGPGGRVMLGTPQRGSISAEEVAVLTGERDG